MSECDLDTSVPDWVIDHPETFSLFRELGIDTCCCGKSLAYACSQQGLDEQAVLKKLILCIDENRNDECRLRTPTQK